MVTDRYTLPEPKTKFSPEDHERMGIHGLDKYALEDIRWEVYRKLKSQFGDPDSGRGEEYYDLTEWRERVEYDISDIEDAISFLRVVDHFPIQQGPTAFVGWYERRGDDRIA